MSTIDFTQIFTPSPQQRNFFRWIETGTGSAVLEAVAGAGKTTTLIEGLRLMEGSVFFGAYNRKIADEIKTKAEDKGVARRGLFISTMHGAGYSAFRRAFPECVVDEKKVAKLIEEHAKEDATIFAYQSFVAKMVSFGKQFLMGVERDVSNFTVWRKLAEHFSADQELPEDCEIETALPYVVAVFEASRAACPISIDFDDMIYAPIAFNVRFFKNDWVLVDECQDLNRARRELASRMLRPGGRLIAVGDSRQAIYGFTGAGSDSVELIAKEFDCTRLPLTVTYRCPRSVVTYVQQWVSHIEAHPSAPEGEVREVSTGQDDAGKARPWYLTDQPAPADAVLCRYTRPLVANAYAMLRDGIACRIEGRDIGNGLIKLARRWKIKTLDALEARMEKHLTREAARAVEKKDERRLEAETDRVETLRVIIERCRERNQNTIDALVAEIESIFSDNVSGVTTLSTVHKSKGREWPRVFWLQAELRGKRVLKPWEATQEENLNYVAGTRAMSSLVLVGEAIHTWEKKRRA